MRFRTHLCFGIFTFFFIDFLIGFHNKTVSFFLVILFSLLPDIDLHTSWIGKRLRFVSISFKLMFGHRGLFHSLWIALVLYLILAPFNFGLTVVGYLSHLFLDMLNKKGIKLFWPFIAIKGKFVSGKVVDALIFYTFLGINSGIVLMLLYNI